MDSGIDFTWYPASPTISQAVTFSAHASGATPICFWWVFGDEGTATGPVVSHTYAISGVFEVGLVAINACSSQIISYSLTVQSECEPPVNVGFVWEPSTPVAGESITFTGSASGTVPIDYLWDFGDGITGTGQVAYHAFEMADALTVAMRARNNCGENWAFHPVEVRYTWELPSNVDSFLAARSAFCRPAG